MLSELRLLCCLVRDTPVDKFKVAEKKADYPNDSWVCAALALLLCFGAGFLFLRGKHDLNDVLGYGVLPATQSLLGGRGFTICSDELAKTLNNPLCFHAARMPMAEWAAALGIKLFGTNIIRLTFYKAILFVLPLVLAACLVYRSFSQTTQYRRLALFLLLIPFTIISFLTDVIRLDFEEAYSYGFIALAFAISLFAENRRYLFHKHVYLGAITAAACAVGVYFSKSSMSLFALTFLFVYLLKPIGPRVKILLLLLSIPAPLGWAIYQHHASGRYSFGTSLDGFNLHMGNSEHFLRDYPPHAGLTLDDTAVELNSGVRFKDEWNLNDYHKKAAISFISSYPEQALKGEWRKFSAIFFSTQVVGTYARPGILASAATCGVVLFRIIFSVALVLSTLNLWRANKPRRKASMTFLLFTAAIVTPYMVGFAYTRHVSVLIFPSCIFCCRLLLKETYSAAYDS